MKQLYKNLIICIILFTIAGCLPSKAQEGLIRGRVVDDVSGKALEYAYILNYSMQKNMYCNSSGEFRLSAHVGDTLVMYALGYDYQKVIVVPSMLGAGKPVDFPLRQQAYELSEARILGIGSYEEFQQQFVALDPPKTKFDYLNESLAEISRFEAVEAYEEAKASGKFGPPTIVAVPILTPEEKERIKLAGIIDQEKVRDQIYQKYNPVVVKQVTGLTDDDEIINFMDYCNFPDKYLMEVNEYDLMTRIALKFEMYKKDKENKSLDIPFNLTDDKPDTLA